MKKLDYYALNTPWHLPKWVGMGLGGIFAVMVIGSMVGIVQLLRPPTIVMAPPPAAPPSTATAPPAQQAVAEADKVEEEIEEPTTAPAPEAAATKPANKRHVKAKGKRGLIAHAKRVAPPARAASGAGKRSAIIAKHDSKEKRRDKDALDKLLGL